MLYSNYIPTKENKFKMTNDELFTYFHDLGIVPVVKIDDANKAEGLAKAMIDGGLPCAEVTFRTDAAEEAIRRISAKYPDMMLGAGTVINPELAEKAVNAGAKFIVSPGLNPDTVKWCLDHNVPVVPGVATPSDIEKGLSLGLKVLKFFPAESSGGVKMLKDLGGPFPQVKFMTTGGISPDNLADYAKTPNVLAIGGSWMVKADLIESENWAEITRLCQEAVIKLQGLQLAHVGINLPDSEAAMNVATDFAKLGLAIKEGNSSIFMNKEIELMKTNYLGKNGHLAFKCYDAERTIFFLKSKGFTINEDTIKMEKGKIKVCYINEEIGGFACHIVKA